MDEADKNMMEILNIHIQLCLVYKYSSVSKIPFANTTRRFFRELDIHFGRPSVRRKSNLLILLFICLKHRCDIHATNKKLSLCIICTSHPEKRQPLDNRFVLLSDGRPSFLSVDKVFEYARTTKSRFMLCEKIVVSVDITLKFVHQKFKNYSALIKINNY